MHSPFDWLGHTHFRGHSLLEWIGILALILLAVWLVARLVRRAAGLTLSRRPQAKADRSVSAPEKERIPGGHEKILIVDDDDTVREVTARILRALGYEVVTEASGDSAVSYMRANGADLILLDLRMEPGLTGVETFRRIREFRPMQKAVVMTAYAGPAEVATVRALGIEHYLIKPAPLRTLARTIRDELDRA